MVTTTSGDRRTALDPCDMYGLDDLLTDDERAIRDTLRAFVNERARPLMADAYEAGSFPRELIPELGALGVLGMALEGYGCAGTSARAYGVATREFEACDSGLRSFVSVQGSLAMFPIWAYGSEEQKLRWLPQMAQGKVIGCFGLTEPDAGSDPSSMRTSARRDGDDWVLSGSKMWITNGSVADVAVVWAQTGEGIGGFLVERGMKGFTASDIPQKLSLRASVTSELHFDNVRLPRSAKLPLAQGLRAPLSCLTEARYGIAWGVLGAAMDCMSVVLRYCDERLVFGAPLGRFQLTQGKLAEMSTSLTTAQVLAWRLAELKEQEMLRPVHVSMAKRNNVRAALDIAREARTILGANGITLAYPVMRHMANLESVLTYEGTEEVHALVIGQALTGQSAFGGSGE